MSKIIAFPKVAKARAIPCPAPTMAPMRPIPRPTPASGVKAGKPFHRRVVCGVWMLTVLVWPILKWLLAIDVAIKCFEALLFWQVPGRHDGLVLLAHFGVLTALTLYVSTRPHDFEA